MRLIERYMIKLLTGSFSKSDFENELYQEHYVAKISEDRLIENLIDVNFNDRFWKAKLKVIAEEHFGEDKFLEILLKYQSLRILESSEKEEVFEINGELASKNIDYDYQNVHLMKFYVLDDEIDYTRSGYGHRSEEEILKGIKSVAREFIEQFPIKD